LLARSPIVDASKPASVRLVLKDEAVLVHINGRMQFGRPLRLHPNVARGRVWLGVYDAQRSRSAIGVVSRFRVGPVKETWIAFKDGGARVGFDEDRLEPLREEAVRARAISPRWLAVHKDGSVVVERAQETLIRSLAGFYGCRLVPMAELPAGGVGFLSDPAASTRLAGGLEAAARELDAAGLNLRMRGADLERPHAMRFLRELRAALRASRRQLWITVDGADASIEGAAAIADGVLRPADPAKADFELLDAVPPPAAHASPKELAIK
jgi:hypothetical protein